MPAGTACLALCHFLCLALSQLLLGKAPERRIPREDRSLQESQLLHLLGSSLLGLSFPFVKVGSVYLEDRARTQGVDLSQSTWEHGDPLKVRPSGS